jgi:3-hydroxyacyl-CoA dehydrogenase
MGPLHVADLIGLDTINAIAEAMYDELKEPLYNCRCSTNRYLPVQLASGRAPAGVAGRLQRI